MIEVLGWIVVVAICGLVLYGFYAICDLLSDLMVALLTFLEKENKK